MQIIEMRVRWYTFLDIKQIPNLEEIRDDVALCIVALAFCIVALSLQDFDRYKKDMNR